MSNRDPKTVCDEMVKTLLADVKLPHRNAFETSNKAYAALGPVMNKLVADATEQFEAAKLHVFDCLQVLYLALQPLLEKQGWDCKFTYKGFEIS